MGPNLSGNINIKEAKNHQFFLDTLDEPIKETLFRDLKSIKTKFCQVLLPVRNKTLVKEWDLWGPLMLCTFLAIFLQKSKSGVANKYYFGYGGPEFAEVFVMVAVGALVVTVNSKLLGCNICFFQSVCVLGYCLLPLVVSLILCQLLLIAGDDKYLFVMRVSVSFIGFVWATYAAMMFFGDGQKPNRKCLASYPIFLFYFVISWLIVSHSK